MMKRHPELALYVAKNKRGEDSIDFTNAEAVKTLNRILLQNFYAISTWDIPPGFLCPPIPGRADYLHYLADLLADANDGVIPKGETVRVLDVGVGANCIYPIIGSFEYGWSFLGLEINPISFASAQAIIDANPRLNHIELRLQMDSKKIFADILLPEEFFSVSMCNPPFHASLAEARATTQRNAKHEKQLAHFGGQNSELWCEGGELAFLRRMIEESATVSKQCAWFTTLVSKENTLPALYAGLKRVKARTWKVIDMEQGQKKNRILAWSFSSISL